MRSEMTGDELRARLDSWGVTRAEAAARLGLSLGGLWDQLTGKNPVSRQTAIILEYRELQRRLEHGKGNLIPVREP
jgi:hypothetical protein